MGNSRLSASTRAARTLASLAAGCALPHLAMAQPAAEPEEQSGNIMVTGERPDSDPTITEGRDSYAPAATNVGKAAQSLREIPQSVTVMTRARIEDQNLLSVEDVMQQMTGVTVDRAWLSSTYTSRGLTITNMRLDGGASAQTSSTTGDLDTAIFDSIALVRGADGLFGAGEAGGVINFNRKRALADPQARASMTFGSWNRARVDADVTGALTSDGNLRARAVGVYDIGESFQDFKSDDRWLAHGSIEYNPAPGTLLLAGYTHQTDKHEGFVVSIPRYRNGEDIGFPRSANMGAPWSTIDRDIDIAYGRIEQAIGNAWTVRLNANYTRSNDRTNAAEMENAVDPVNGAGTDWWYYQAGSKVRELTLDLNTTGSFEAFGQKHDVVLGVDYTRNRTDNRSLWTYYGVGDVFDPVSPPEIAYPPVWGYQGRTDIKRLGFYGSLRIRPVAPLSLIGGGRLVVKDRAEASNIATGAVTSLIDQKTKFVPYVATVLDVSQGVSLYASYAEIYQSQANYMSAPRPGTPLAPVTGTNYEAGIKGELAGGRLTGSLAVYRVRKKGAFATDPSNPPAGSTDNCCYIRDGSLRSQGFEAEVNGEILPGWQVSVGYTYNDNENRRENDASFAEITPKHLLKVFTDYKFREGALKGFSMGGGVTAQSSNFRSGWVQELNPATGLYDGPFYQYQFKVPGYAIWSLRAEYEVSDQFSISANVNNLFDKKYYMTIGTPGYGNFYGDPRNFLVSLRGKF
ncbi:TonB-dependent siderophore receptor [Novosphingobium sp. TCA1]|uniref:TonB-dependent siderophore receptor n=1 Tax=Novosphingobium pentaromativorans TaxID=205844 RepID=A0A2W5Q6T8_9SPHN|nr:TonB-dependent siderophore receptor [Novosphingobium sp. TCA1]PZQ53117.1 MAG: TonB-dependent siderophore receptor [Novosphingobium pentaromativorans]GFE75017.1 ligand-gated channel [Novosphingobium sp. TCA1]